jgi:CheY-like chemotaxis protein
MGAMARLEPHPVGREAVLVVEDDAVMRRTVVRQLTRLGYRVYQAEDGAKALELMSLVSIDLLFSDIVMPSGVDGLRLARTAIAYWPRLKVLLTSGYVGAGAVEDSSGPGLRLLGKPYRAVELEHALSDLLGPPASGLGAAAATR